MTRLTTSLLIALICLAPVSLARAGDDAVVLKAKVKKLVDAKFGGDWDRAHAHYAEKGETKGGALEKADMQALLEDAGIGNWLTRATKVLDKDGDKRVSRQEWTDFNVHDPGVTTLE